MLHNVQRVTLSLPHVTIFKLEASIPKNKRSKFIAELIEKSLNSQAKSLDETRGYWNLFAKKYPTESDKSAAQLVSDDRSSH